jgi:MoxR-like ATPase
MSLILEHEITIADAAVMLEILTDAGDPVMMWGKPGIGKSDIVHQLGAKKQRKVIEFHAALRETVDLRGIPIADPATGTTKWLVPAELPQAERDGEFGYLFCDEINQASPQMQGVLGGLILYGVIGDYRLPPGWRVIAAGNRVSDRAAAQRMPTHMRNRFAHLFIMPDVNAWCVWANANKVAPEVVAFVRLRRELLHMMPKGDENAFPTPRSLTKAAKYVNAPTEHRLRLFAAHVGDAVAAELDGFIELYRSLGSLDDIVADPDGAKVPTEPSCRYAVCTGLGRIATRKNFPNIIRYAKRLNRESEVLVVTDATGRDASLKDTTAYGKWAVANQDLTVQ